jgi:hypothetical protein
VLRGTWGAEPGANQGRCSSGALSRFVIVAVDALRSVRGTTDCHRRQNAGAREGMSTEHLEPLRIWLREHRVKRAAMGSTGVYWIPIWNVLERKPARFELLLLNPQHVRALPGRKTATFSELLHCGLVRVSFVPPVPIREARDLTRARVHGDQDRNRVTNRRHRCHSCVIFPVADHGGPTRKSKR